MLGQWELRWLRGMSQLYVISLLTKNEDLRDFIYGSEIEEDVWYNYTLEIERKGEGKHKAF